MTSVLGRRQSSVHGLIRKSLEKAWNPAADLEQRLRSAGFKTESDCKRAELRVHVTVENERSGRRLSPDGTVKDVIVTMLGVKSEWNDVLYTSFDFMHVEGVGQDKPALLLQTARESAIQAVIELFQKRA